MKLKRVAALAMAGTMAVSLAACGGKTDNTNTTPDTQSAAGTEKGSEAKQEGIISYADLNLDSDCKDLKASISFFNNRTDLDSDEYKGTTWKQYIEAFNKDFPNIEVKVLTSTNFAEDALTHLQSGDYETVMCIPAVDKADLSTYFMSYGDLDTMKGQVNYADNWMYDNQVYGVPSTATTQGVVYNKKVFADAGVSSIPTTPDEFIDALKKIKDKFGDDCVPLYTNYAAGWTMGAWDDYIANTATGDTTYKNQKLLHTKDPFKDYGDGTHPYAVYKILYDAVSNGLTEKDYTTTDWEGSKSMLNNGQIGCMVLGSWSYSQMMAAGDNADDVGYMPFPISVDGKQYASSGPDYNWAINANATDDEKQAALVFVKWMMTKSGYNYNEGGLPVVAGDSETKLDFGSVDFVSDEPAVSGEEDLLNALNADSELNISNGGNDKIQQIIEHAAKGDMSFDDIMKEWNEKWSAAQETEKVEVTE